MSESFQIDGAPICKIDYAELNARQQENYNFHKIAAVFADYGFNCIKLDDDWMGADFLAYHKDHSHTLKVQLKSRPTIDTKYKDKDLHIAFPLKEHWYVVRHDDLVDIMQQHSNWLNTRSWTDKGHYSSVGLPAALIEQLEKYKFGPVYR